MTAVVSSQEKRGVPKATKGSRRGSKRVFARRRKRSADPDYVEGLEERIEPVEIRVAAEDAPSLRVVDEAARNDLQSSDWNRRQFLRNSALGAGLFAMGVGLGYGTGHSGAVGLSGNTRTVITDTEIAARVIAGMRIATEFIPEPVPAGTDADPYPGSAIQAALEDGLKVYIPSGTWALTSTIRRAADNVAIMGAGKSTKLLFDGSTPCISAGSQNGWLIANLATDAGGVDISSTTQSRVTEVWVDGVLTDNRPLAVGGGDAGGYYGVLAADYITTGDGTPSNPYNASAIQNAINTLPSRGGIVFIKEGVWGRTGESRITIDSTGNKRVILQGAGAAGSQYWDDANALMFIGTHVRAGFDCHAPADFYDMSISPRVGQENNEPGIKYIVDPNKGPTVFIWLGGFNVKRCTFKKCSPGIWMTGENFGATNAPWQIWKAWMEQLFFDGGGTAIKADIGDSDSNNYPGQLELTALQISANGAGGAGAGSRTIDIQVGNIRGLWSNWLLENCSKAGVDYTMYVSGAGMAGGLIIQNIFFGDGSLASKDARIAGGTSLIVRNFTFLKDLDISGRGWYQVARGANATGVVNVTNGQDLKLESIPGESVAHGSLSFANPDTVLIKHPFTGIAVVDQAAGTSPYEYRNTTGYELCVYLVGGTLSDVERRRDANDTYASVGAQRVHYLSPGDRIRITYSGSVTIKGYNI